MSTTKLVPKLPTSYHHHLLVLYKQVTQPLVRPIVLITERTIVGGVKMTSMSVQFDEQIQWYTNGI